MVNYQITLPRNYSNVITQKYIQTGVKSNHRYDFNCSKNNKHHTIIMLLLVIVLIIHLPAIFLVILFGLFYKSLNLPNSLS